MVDPEFGRGGGAAQPHGQISVLALSGPCRAPIPITAEGKFVGIKFSPVNNQFWAGVQPPLGPPQGPRHKPTVECQGERSWADLAEGNAEQGGGDQLSEAFETPCLQPVVGQS